MGDANKKKARLPDIQARGRFYIERAKEKGSPVDV